MLPGVLHLQCGSTASTHLPLATILGGCLVVPPFLVPGQLFHLSPESCLIGVPQLSRHIPVAADSRQLFFPSQHPGRWWLHP